MQISPSKHTSLADAPAASPALCARAHTHTHTHIHTQPTWQPGALQVGHALDYLAAEQPMLLDQLTLQLHHQRAALQPHRCTAAHHRRGWRGEGPWAPSQPASRMQAWLRGLPAEPCRAPQTENTTAGRRVACTACNPRPHRNTSAPATAVCGTRRRELASYSAGNTPTSPSSPPYATTCVPEWDEAGRPGWQVCADACMHVLPAPGCVLVCVVHSCCGPSAAAALQKRAGQRRSGGRPPGGGASPACRAAPPRSTPRPCWAPAS